MNQNEDIIKILEELHKETGLALTLENIEEADESITEKLTSLLQRVRSKGSRNETFLRYLTGLLSENEAKSLLYRTNQEIQPMDFFLFYFPEAIDQNSGILSVLSELVDSSSTEFLQSGPNELLLLKTTENTHTSSELHEIANNFVDMLNTEAMTSVLLSFDETIEDFSKLPVAYQHLRTAMEVGRTFYSDQQIYDYHSLGLGKLISSIPKEQALEFLQEELPSVHFDEFDAETLNTIEVFFDTGLNIAETARILYLHRNTLVYRLDKFYKTTGRDLRNFDDAVTVRIGMLLSRANV